MKATLVEHKRYELAEPKDYVSGNDGNLYKVIEYTSNIYLDNGNRYVNAIVELADWEDVEEGWERGCIARVEQC